MSQSPLDIIVDGKREEAPAAVTETVTTPVTTETVETPVVAETKTEKTFDESSWLADVSGGEWKSKDDVINFRQKFQETVSEVGKTKDSYKDYIKPHNDWVRKVNEISERGGDVKLFLETNSFDVDKLSDEEAVKYQLRWQKKLTPEEADFKVKRQYKAGSSEPQITEDMLDDEKARIMEQREDFRAAQMELKINAREAREYLKGEQVKASTVPDPNEANQKRIEGWNPHIEKLIAEGGILSEKISLDKDGKEVLDFNFELTKEQKETLKKTLTDTIQGLPSFVYEDGQSYKDLINTWAFTQNREQYLDAFKNKIASHYEEKWKSRVNGKSEKSDTPLTSGGKTQNQTALDAIANNYS